MLLPRLAWILGVGIPGYFLIYVGLFNLIGDPIPDYTYGIQLAYETSIIAIIVGAMITYGLFFHYTMRSSKHGRHCELTSFLEFFVVIAFIGFTINLVFGYAIHPYGNAIEWVIIFGLASIAGGIGIILYRFERHKKIIPF